MRQPLVVDENVRGSSLYSLPSRQLVHAPERGRTHPAPRWQRLASRVLGVLKADPYGNFFEDRTNERLRKFLSPRGSQRASTSRSTSVASPTSRGSRGRGALLEDHLNHTTVGFEWGSGNGTLWILRRVKSLTSVEHHKAWSETVKKRLSNAGVTNADYRYVEESSYGSSSTSSPTSTSITSSSMVSFRDLAMTKSMPKLKRDGWLVLDN